MNRTYEHIPCPRYDQALHAVSVWDQIASNEGLQYCFVGSIVARMNGDDFQIFELEILVHPSVRANNWRRLTGIMNSYHNFLATTPSGRRIVVIEESQGMGRGIPMRFFDTGSVDYRDELIPPPGSYFHNAQHVGLAQTYRGQFLPYPPPHNRCVPVLRFHLLLRQRILRFNPYSRDPEVRGQNRRDVDDIRVFLRGAAICHEPPFPDATAEVLLPVVRRWINYTRTTLFIPITREEVRWWRVLNIGLTENDVAQ